MNRRDTIIISVLVNVGLLALLFTTAWYGESDQVADQSVVSKALAEARSTPPSAITISQQEENCIPKDEIDQMLQRYASAQQAQLVSSSPKSVVEVTPATSQTVLKPLPTLAVTTDAKTEGEFIQVTVKRGDVLDKIARANGTTSDQIMNINNLSTPNLKIGQILKVPKGISKAIAQVTKPKPITPTKELATSDISYYTIAAGDNPTNIARKHSMKVEELLKINNLDETKARNLKIGDKLKVR